MDLAGDPELRRGAGEEMESEAPSERIFKSH